MYQGVEGRLLAVCRDSGAPWWTAPTVQALAGELLPAFAVHVDHVKLAVGAGRAGDRAVHGSSNPGGS